MDWFDWLSKTGLEPYLVYNYGLKFVQNELEEEDMAYFNHEFLLSMGISIAKHRLLILNLATKGRGGGGPHLMARALVTFKRTRNSVGKYLRAWVRKERSPMFKVHRAVGKCNSLMRALPIGKMMKMSENSRTLRLTNGSPKLTPGSRRDSFSSLMICDDLVDDQMTVDGDRNCWLISVEETKWDTLFKNMRPT